MTKVGQIIANEIDEAVKKAEMETEKKVKMEADESREQSAVALLEEGLSIEKIARCLKMPEERVQQLKEMYIDSKAV